MNMKFYSPPWIILVLILFQDGVSLWKSDHVSPTLIQNRGIKSLDISRIQRDNGAVEFQVITFVEKYLANLLIADELIQSTTPFVEVDVFSTLHIGTSDYYKCLTEALTNYDVVLYELITSEKNILYDTKSTFKKRLAREVFAPQAAKLSEQLKLEDQMKLPLTADNWFIADLESEKIFEEESSKKLRMLTAYLVSVISGRSSSNNFFQRFFISDTWLLSMLRLFAWLTPCPELNCLLVDWSRMSPKAGGLSPLLIPIITLFSQGNAVETKRLLFAQQLVAGLPDWGSWGGEAQSDIEIRVKSRNSECCRILEGFLEEIRQTSKINPENLFSKPKKKIAIVYGSYHIEDLCYRLENQLGLFRKTDVSKDYAQNFTAWSITVPSNRPMNVTREITDRVSEKSSISILPIFQSIIIPTLLFSLYLFLSALDWWVMVKVIVQDIRFDFFPNQYINHLDHLSEYGIWTLGYGILYLQRHLWLLRSVSSVGVQWDKSMFTDSSSPVSIVNNNDENTD